MIDCNPHPRDSFLLGADITNSFLDIGHSEAATNLMRDFYIGTVDLTSKPVFVQPVVQQTDYSGLALPIIIILIAVLAYFYL